MATLSEIRNDILLFLRETGDDTNFTTPELNSFVNKAVEITAGMAEIAEDSIEVAVEKDVPGYTLALDNLLITSAYFGDNAVVNDLRPLEIFTKATIQKINPFW